MPTLTSRYAARSDRRCRFAQPVPGLLAGQCFDIEITPDVTGWVIRIPEIDGNTRATRRVAVEVAARKYIAARTGIPIGYIAVRVRD